MRRIGVEPDPETASVARGRAGLEIIEAGLPLLPFDTGSFDAVICINVIGTMGVPDDDEALRELQRVLRPGGLLVLMVGAYDWLRSSHDRVARNRWRFTTRELHRMLGEDGFRVGRVSYRVCLPLPVAIIARLAPWRSATRTDVQPMNATVNRLLRAVVTAEDAMMRRTGLPAGLSVFAVSRGL